MRSCEASNNKPVIPKMLGFGWSHYSLTTGYLILIKLAVLCGLWPLKDVKQCNNNNNNQGSNNNKSGPRS